MDRVQPRGNIFGCGCIPARYTFAILGCLGVALVYGVKVNLHVAVIAMMNHTYMKANRSKQVEANVTICNHAHDKEKAKDGPFLWSEQVQGIVLSSYFVGYLIGQLPGGRIAEIYSAFWAFFASAAINILGALLTPLFSTVHWGMLVALRVIMGLAGGLNLPSMHVLLAHWCPLHERNVIASVVYAGIPLGTMVYQLSTGYICEYLSWQAVFYIHGAVSCVFLPLWYIMVSNTPSHHKWISQEEREMIRGQLRDSVFEIEGAQGLRVPWKKIWTSTPFYAILIAHICSDWGFYTLLVELPQYMKRVLGLSIQQITTYTAVPYLTMWIYTLAHGSLFDYLEATGRITMTCMRKFSTALQAAVPALCLTVLCIVPCVHTLAIVMFTVALTFYGATYSGFMCNHIDIAPNFAGTLLAITNTIATVPGVAVPLFCGQLFKDSASFTPWMVLFIITIALYIVQIVVYLILGTARVQPWNFAQRNEVKSEN